MLKESSSSSHEIKLTLRNSQVINSDNAVIVNFHAEWCEPCKILTPKMTELLEDNLDIDLAVVDVDSNIE